LLIMACTKNINQTHQIKQVLEPLPKDLGRL